MPQNVKRHSQMAKTAQIRWSKIPPCQTSTKVKIVSNCPYYFTIAYIVIYSHEVFSGVSLACCCIYWAGLIALRCRSQRYWWLWDKLSTKSRAKAYKFQMTATMIAMTTILIIPFVPRSMVFKCQMMPAAPDYLRTNISCLAVATVPPAPFFITQIQVWLTF